VPLPSLSRSTPTMLPKQTKQAQKKKQTKKAQKKLLKSKKKETDT
jgi:hypothetical protein